MESVVSADGTRIAFERSGSGPSLVLVHGASASAKRWGNIRPLLDKHFTVIAMDRRGRGGSGDIAPGTPYALEREYEDVEAVVATAGEPVILFGHSYGGLSSLGAMRTLNRVSALVIYEAPVPTGPLLPEELLERLEDAARRDDRDGIMKMFCEEVVRMRPSDIATLRASPAWPARLAAAHTIPREMLAVETFSLAATQAERIPVPTLLLHGGDSPDFFKSSMAKLAAAIPHAQTLALEGQQHVAMDTAPETLTAIVRDFWTEVSGAS